MTTYVERVARYRIYRHDDLPEGHKAEYRAQGIDPDTLWRLVWSFEEYQAAVWQLQDLREDAAAWETYKLVDNGEAEYIDRPIY